MNATYNFIFQPDRFFSKMSRWIALLFCLPVFFVHDTNAEIWRGFDDNGNEYTSIYLYDFQTGEEIGKMSELQLNLFFCLSFLENCRYTCFGSTCQMRYLGEDMGSTMGSCSEPGWSGDPCTGKPEKCQYCNDVVESWFPCSMFN